MSSSTEPKRRKTGITIRDSSGNVIVFPLRKQTRPEQTTALPVSKKRQNKGLLTPAVASGNVGDQPPPAAPESPSPSSSRVRERKGEAGGPHNGRTLDLYAPSYTPQYLLAINESMAIDRFCTPLKTIDFADYIRRFAGISGLEPLLTSPLPDIHKPTVSLSRHTTNLSPSTYQAYFHECLHMETYNASRDLSNLNLYNIQLEISDAEQRLYRLEIPGLRDDAPRIDLTDVILVRQIVPFPDLTQQGAEWYRNPESKSMNIAPGFTGQVHHAVVWGVSRTTETVLLRIDNFLPSWPRCNVIFKVQPARYVRLWDAVSKAYEGLPWPPSGGNNPLTPGGGVQDKDCWMNRMLFPEPEHSISQRELPRGVFPYEWIDSELNGEQMKAVDSVISRNYGTMPFLISGVPGSGKTKTVVECALQLLKSHGNTAHHIIMCAESDPAADTLALRLRHHLQPWELFRLNGPTRSFAEVPSVLMQYTQTEDDLFSLPDFKRMMKFKVVVTTCRDADMLVQARLTNADLLNLAYETLSAVSPGLLPLIPDKVLHWTALIVDEAAQATEPAVCIPLTVVANPLSLDASDEKSSLPLVVMAGDQHQLSPKVYSTETALSVSLFERLSSRPVYADHPLSRRNAGPRKRLTQAMLPMPRPAFTNLIRNYRSHPAILAIPSVLFYSDTLLPCATRAHPDGPVPTWPGWKGPHRWPVLFCSNVSADTVEQVLHGPTGSGLHNHGEALKAHRIVRSLLDHSSQLDYPENPGPGSPQPLREEDIAIISPFNSQVVRLRKVFRERGLYGVNIGPLEAFQGLETRFLIICTTRTRMDKKIIEHDQALRLGLIGEKKRFNVALTRAKEGLIVIGNPALLGAGPVRDESWRAFLSFCARNGCWEPAPGKPDKPRHARYEKDALDGQRTGGSEPGEAADHGSVESRQDPSYWERKLAGLVSEDSSSAKAGNEEADEKDPRLEGYVSSLEYALLYDEKVHSDSTPNGEPHGHGTRRLGGAHADDAYDAAMWVSGTAAEEVLRGWEERA